MTQKPPAKKDKKPQESKNPPLEVQEGELGDEELDQVAGGTPPPPVDDDTK